MSKLPTSNYYQQVYDGQSSLQIVHAKANCFNENSFLKRNKLIRDVVIWFFMIFVLPILLVIIFYLIQFTTMKNISNRNAHADNHTTMHFLDFRSIKKSPSSSKFSNDSLSRHLSQPMKLHLLKSQDALCNDGTPSGYYFKKTQGNSKTWIIMLEGGYFCNDIDTCTQRLVNSPSLTSSASWSEHKKGYGILSSKKFENKYFWDANLVYIPYCSSDMWIGTRKKSDSIKFNFLGYNILNAVIDELLNYYSMNESYKIIFIGISAGGTGLLMNIDSIHDKIKSKAPQAQVKALLDSAWIIDLPNYSCTNKELKEDSCLISRLFRQAYDFWNAKIPTKLLGGVKYPWETILSNKVLHLIKTPIFVLQSLFDETYFIEQRMPVYRQDSQVKNFKQTIKFINFKLKKSLTHTKNFFIPACITHMITIKKNWNKFQIGKHNLEEVIKLWIDGDMLANNEKILDNCSYPNCNPTCPSPKDLVTNQDINPLQYFRYYNLINIEQLSKSLNISLKNFNKLSYDDIMKSLLF